MYLAIPRLLAAFYLIAILGCGEQPIAKKTPSEQTAKEDSKIREALDKLSPEDRALAESQRYCAVNTRNPLGSMGTPVKVMIQNQPVFLCCDSCERRAKADGDRTLERAKKLRESSGEKK